MAIIEAAINPAPASFMKRLTIFKLSKSSDNLSDIKHIHNSSMSKSIENCH